MFKAYSPEEETLLLNFGGTHNEAVRALVTPDLVPEYSAQQVSSAEVLYLSKEFEVEPEPELLFQAFGT